jgi:hypothetical protein
MQMWVEPRVQSVESGFQPIEGSIPPGTERVDLHAKVEAHSEQESHPQAQHSPERGSHSVGSVAPAHAGPSRYGVTGHKGPSSYDVTGYEGIIDEADGRRSA